MSSSSSSSCQALQSCLEPALVIEPRVLRMKLTPSQPNIMNDTISSSAHNNVESGGWSFLQSLAENQPVYKDEPYNPPNCKRRGSSVLSEKSLEMCTESLGSETGSETSDEMGLLSSEIPENYIESSGLKHSRLQRETTPRMSRNYSFPPPLNSICGGGSSVQMRRRREDGRLVLEAVSVSNSSPAYFQAERIDGRLRLHLMKHSDFQSEDEPEEEEEEEQEEEEEEGNAGDENGSEKLTMLSRCKEGGSGNKKMLNWEPLWVAT